MEQKKEFETRRDYQEDDLPFPYLPERPTHFLDYGLHKEYETFNVPINLDDNQLKVALRLLKYYLEEHISLGVPDGLFLGLIKIYPYWVPKYPLSTPYARRGYSESISRILNDYGYQSIPYLDLTTFFVNRTYDDRQYRRLILHVPHASMVFPVDSCYTFKSLNGREQLLIDYYTDELFVPTDESENINAMVFPYCRLYCDVERMTNDPLEAKGLGISYHYDVRTTFGDRRRSFSTLEEAFKHYANFHAEMSKTITEGWGKKLLIDCHSFSSHPNLLCSDPPDIDICIGFNNDETFPGKVVIGNIKYYFESLGYKVSINTPFSNSKTFEVPVKYHSVMIEVNKRLYMNEQTHEKTDGFDTLRQDIQSLYSKLLK